MSTLIARLSISRPHSPIGPSLGARPKNTSRCSASSSCSSPPAALTCTPLSSPASLCSACASPSTKRSLPGRDQLAHARRRGRSAAKIGAPMHQRDARGLGRQLERPVERRVSAAEDHELAAVKVGGVLDAIVDLRALEGLGARSSARRRGWNEPTPRRDHDRAGIEHGAGTGGQAKAARSLGGRARSPPRRDETRHRRA